MPVSSRKALKITGIPEETTEIAYHEFVECLCQQTANNHESSTAAGDRGDNAPFILSRKSSWTLARQHEHLVGTVSFPSHSDKMKALKRLGKRKALFWRDWSIEHVFRGITVLYENEAKTEFVTSPCPKEPSEDRITYCPSICFVHGLGGNAFDTWTVSNGGSMWPRDFLPSPKHFPNSRIMTFGYDSDLTDSTTLMTMESCAQSLLRGVNEVRNSDEVSDRAVLWGIEAC
jgi:hypothetical protein